MTWDQQSVKQLREALGLTQSELARELGCRQQTVSEWELGLYSPANAYGKLLSHLELRMRQTALIVNRPTQAVENLHGQSGDKILNYPHEYVADSIDKGFDPAID